MQPSPTHLYLPPHLPFPIKIISLDTISSHHVLRGTRLLTYSFLYQGAKSETRFGTWDASIEGTLDAWLIKPGDVLSLHSAKDNPVVVIIEPCKHGMQLGGLCVLCGKDMTNVDYTGFSDASRASIQMTHSAFGPTVSLEEAQRIERETADHLLKSRKLSLVVDLDQTILHATVDPTVGEWIAEGENWEQQQQANKTPSKPEESAGQSEDKPSDADECPNPNWEALKDVGKFRLGPESFDPPSMRGKGKNRENEGVYYIKPRPGWKEFLKEAAKKYEMHVYTMGTRAYAEQVCSAIDPDGKLFSGRLLSRDESDSLTQKSLRRLFPCDTSTVVIIDDRADVWEWSPNLIKVIPYEFFVGIGDINSTFLPKLEPLTAGSSIQTPSLKPPATTSPESTPTGESAPTEVEEVEEAEAAEAAVNAMLKQNTLALELQLEERPLAKKQAELLRAAEESSSHGQHPPGAEQEDTKATDQSQVADDREARKHDRERKALLKNEDHELVRVAKLLDEVHKRFFEAYDSRFKEHNQHKRRKIACDVTRIIPQIRSEIFVGVHIMFSSVIPLDTMPETTEIWRMAHMFGAKCSTELSNDVTHVVAAKRGTVKVDAARKRGGVRIVWLAWFMDSVALWRRQDETQYFLDEPSAPASGAAALASSPTVNSSQQVSSEPDTDSEWDVDPAEHSGTLELDEIDWNDISVEVEAAMNESDDSDEGEEGTKRSVVGSEGESTGESNSLISNRRSTPTLKRKRYRSITPSEGRRGKRMNGSGNEDGLGSPLAKRKRLAAERTGYSRLKVAITADDLEQGRESEAEDAMSKKVKMPRTVEREEKGGEEGDGDGDDEGAEEEEEEDDFLARELEEDWG
ncbi:hypothetical protein AX17_000234 [Amanita inopinata Kibby_2008]|nr:hypothetical protein AX17_000234 [Amanita inopinata Kibby_2008]